MAEPNVQPLEIKGKGRHVKASAPTDYSLWLAGKQYLIHHQIVGEKVAYLRHASENKQEHVVQGVIDYIYGMDITVQWKDIAEYVEMAACSKIMDLKDLLEDYIVKNENLIRLTWVDWSLRCTKLELLRVKSCLDYYISFNFGHLFTTKDYFRLNFHQLKLILSPDVLFEISADDKVKGCISWKTHSPHSSNVSLQDLVTCFGLTFSAELYELVRKYGKMANIEDYSHVMSVIHPSRGKLKLLHTGWTMLVLGNQDLFSRKLFKFDFQNETVEEIGLVPKQFQSEKVFCSTPFGIFSIGKNPTPPACQILDVHTLNFQRLPDFHFKLHKIRAAFMSGKVYVLGYNASGQGLFSLDINCEDIWRWEHTFGPLLPTVQIAPMCCVGETLYFLHKKLYCYRYKGQFTKPEVKELSCPSKYSHAWNFGVEAVGTNLYMLGCKCPDGNVSYNVNSASESAAWSYVPPSLLPRDGHCSAVYLPARNAIVLCSDFNQRIELFDLKTKQWMVSKMEIPYESPLFTMVV